MKKLFFDIKAFLILRKEVRKNRNSLDWKKYNLRHDWLYRIYTVINPTESAKGDDDAMINMKAIDRVAPINKYIASMGLAEIVSLSMEKVPDSDSHLVVYYQIYNWISPWRIISRIAIISVLIWAINKYGGYITKLF